MSNRYVTATGFVAEAGTVIDQKFRLLEHIGTGGTAKVWRAHHLLGRFDCVLKFMNADRRSYTLGLDEFRLLSNIYHPNIVRTFDIGELADFDQAYISMELVEGDPLCSYVDDGATADPNLVAKWLSEMVDVLRYIHLPALRIIHKDVKPSNIMASARGSKLIDFNISTSGSAGHGTPAYKCPTVDQGFGWTAYADVWALAVTFYEVLTRRPLFETATAFDVVLDDQCPFGFPVATFNRLKSIIHGEGATSGVEVERYREFFGLGDARPRIETIPAQLVEAFSISSKNHHFLCLALMNQGPAAKPRSKEQVIIDALHEAGRPAGALACSQLRPVYSQLKARGVVEYSGKGLAKVRLTDAFLTKWRATQPR